MAKKPTEEETPAAAAAVLDPANGFTPAELAAATPAEEAPKGISEEEIQEKVRAGLRRDQALEVITTQRAHDAALAKAAKAGN